MKAWQLNSDGSFTRNEVQEPVPGPHEFLLEVKAAGLCHSDVGLIDGTIGGPAGPPRTPITLGHEIAGTVVALGPDPLSGIAIGDRVALQATGFDDSPGGSRDGGYAPLVIGRTAEASYVPIPEGLGFEHAAVATDAGTTSYNAVMNVGRVGAGKRVGIVGLGGLGAIGARIAVLAGAEVYAAEPRDAVRESAPSRLGVKAAVNDVRDLAGLGLEIIIDFAGFGSTTAGAIDVINVGGGVVQVGIGRAEATISTTALVAKMVTLVGSLGGTRTETEAVLGLIASGDLSVELDEIDFESIGDGIDRLRRGDALGRLVARINQ
ncbi:alcohol dehydrogenase catalytic domain-containing protein [Streptomyces sp. Li-HN-5-11]|uniref:alcohol dehydrogenase catalytic domain-containing protein n=1 Tax=Streptomyces sp. Li-HN-5-11 TaxID=3075432 RepID=UPI0028A84DB1|nr:zinc-binding dehydrogenase [Streptomyces sp. Li-HN-5-11]WNM31948.1 alcohol dehydrogenase catalytic domain-containing protein [Streptomyces sp. Li-HN-5-11]